VEARTLKAQRPPPPTLPNNPRSPSDVALGVAILDDHLDKLREEVFEKIATVSKSVEGVGASVPGRVATMRLLASVAGLIPTLELAERGVERARQPMRFARPDSSIVRRIARLRRDLQNADEFVGA
jgi:hypothetical protein